MYNRNFFALAVIILFASGIFASVFTADYLYLDEAYQLWYPDRNYSIFATQGRLLIGIVYHQLFTFIDTAGEMKYIRVISFAGWIISSFILYHLSKRWVQQLSLSKYLPFLLAVFCICSSSVAIYIGWGGSCLQMFPAFLFGLFSGHLAFQTIIPQSGKFKLSPVRIGLSIVSGVIALLFYQTLFGVFILPFLLLWISGNVQHKVKKIIVAIIIYLATYLTYFLFFKFYLKTLQLTASDRTEIAFNPLKKIAFFFSTPFSQAWNMNLLVNLHNIVSQVIPLLLFVTWLFLFIRQSPDKKIRSIASRVGCIFVLLGLSYLPSLIATENFSSYRTMLAFSLCTFSLLMTAVLTALKTDNIRRLFVQVLALFLFIVGYKNFNINFIRPLRKEFAALKTFPSLQQVRKGDTVVFIRPDAKLFKRLYGISGYKDEFGLPSTYRDWSPEEITRQLIKEQQTDAIARSIAFYQFAAEVGFPDSLKHKLTRPVIIDMNTIVK